MVLLLLPLFLQLTISWPILGQPHQSPPNPSSPSSPSLPWICPNNAALFDTNSCDPNALFTCPANFKCRLAIKRTEGLPKGTKMIAGPAQEVRFLCCESRQLGIQEWLLDSSLSPAIFPKMPNSTLWQVVLRDPQSGRQAKVDENGAELSLLSADPGFANFSQLDEIDFPEGEAPAAKGFLHVLEAINQLATISALRLHFDYPSFGSQQLDLHSLNQRFPRGFVQSVTSGFVPADDFYRRQHVLLVFKSNMPLTNRTADIERWMGWSEGKFPKLMWENGSGMPGLLGKPLAGFMFNLTTRGSMFPVSFDDGRGPIPPPANSDKEKDEDGGRSDNKTPTQVDESAQPPIGQLAYDPGLPPMLPTSQSAHRESNTTEPCVPGGRSVNNDAASFLMAPLLILTLISPWIL